MMNKNRSKPNEEWDRGRGAYELLKASSDHNTYTTNNKAESE